jgi:hypothetical protein
MAPDFSSLDFTLYYSFLETPARNQIVIFMCQNLDCAEYHKIPIQ